MNSLQFPSFSSEETKSNTLGDGVHECTFGSLPALFKSLDSFFSERSLAPDTTLAFQVDNSLPGAILLLWLIHNKFRFYLGPPTPDDGSVWDIVPNFCSHLIRIAETDLESFAQDAPPWDRILHVEENPNRLKRENNKTLQHPEGMLYIGTSGTKGKPKIVTHTLESLLGNARNVQRRFKFNHRDRVMIPVPIFHIYGLGAGFLPALLGGTSIELQKNPNIIKYLERERRFRPNIAFLTPLLCTMLYKGKRDNTAYRLIVTAGQKIQQALVETFDAKFGGCLINLYGSSEMGAICASQPDDPIELKSLTVGQPMPEVQIRLQSMQDTVEERTSTEDAGGLLFVKHPFGFSGYIDEEGNYLAKHQPDQWYRTGDWGVVNPDGHLNVVGRADNQVNRSGFLISLANIETKIGEIPDISEVVVLALEEETLRGPTLVAVCVLNRDSSDLESPENINGALEKIQQYFHDVLPSHSVPDRTMVIPSFPYLPSGKIDRQSLKRIVENKPECGN